VEKSVKESKMPNQGKEKGWSEKKEAHEGRIMAINFVCGANTILKE